MKVHVWGASGYAAAEAIRILERHPAELGVLESRSHAGERVGDHFPLLRSSSRRFDPEGSVLGAARASDVVLVCGAHGEARAFVPKLLAAGVRVIDFSADFRLDRSAVYGLTEWNHPAIAEAALVANPGCYATAALLAMLPLATFRAPQQWIVDAKSGVTGAGRSPNVRSLFAEIAEEVRVYGLDGHRHQPEIEALLRLHHAAAPLVFTPHVVPVSRGILADVYAVYEATPSPRDVNTAFAGAYENSAFIRILSKEQTPSVAAVARTNDAELRVDVRGNVIRILCAIDNLGKGAAGQAVQNLNIMLGYPEETGLHEHTIVA
jgi:N-acetyl-gamma-glutamyl-phosphate reductase